MDLALNAVKDGSISDWHKVQSDHADIGGNRLVSCNVFKLEELAHPRTDSDV